MKKFGKIGYTITKWYVKATVLLWAFIGIGEFGYRYYSKALETSIDVSDKELWSIATSALDSLLSRSTKGWKKSFEILRDILF